MMCAKSSKHSFSSFDMRLSSNIYSYTGLRVVSKVLYRLERMGLKSLALEFVKFIHLWKLFPIFLDTVRAKLCALGV